MTVLTLVPRYCDVVDDSAVTRWLAAHHEMVEHWEAMHRQAVEVPGPCCMKLLAEEARLFTRVERMGDGYA
jgi:hypothetical protein